MATGVGAWVQVGLGLGPSLATVCWYLELAKSGLLANLVSSLYKNGKDLGYPTHCRRKTSLSPVAISFVEFRPRLRLDCLQV